MHRALILMTVCLHLCFLFANDKGMRKYENHVYYFTMDLPGATEKTMSLVEPKPPQPAHGFSIEIDGKRRSIEVYSGYNATYQENTAETFHEWLQEVQVKDTKILSCGGYINAGLIGFRAISIPTVCSKSGVMHEVIRVYRKSLDGSPGIWYEFMLNSDTDHYIDDSNLFNRLLTSFRLIKSKNFE